MTGVRPAVSTNAVRWVVVFVCGGGIAGMIVSSINDNTGAALTFGLVTTAAVMCLVVATAVTRPAGGGERPPPGAQAPLDEAQAAHVEGLVARLVATGADEQAVRSLVREAVRLGRSGWS